jgi:acyl carrier protein
MKGRIFVMTNTEKLALIEEIIEADEGTLNEDMNLKEIENWDSMAVISLIVMIDDKLGKKVSVSQIKDAKTVGDILNIME